MKAFSLLLLICLALLLPSAELQAQLSMGGKPHSFSGGLKSNLSTYSMEAVDVEKYLAEDAIEEEQGLPFRFGAPFDVNYDLYNSGTWETLADGSRIWRIEIVSSGAYTINLLFSNYYLPPGATMYVYNSDQSQILGAFTEQNNKDYGTFATSPTKGDVAIVEYFEPANMKGAGQLTISRVVHGYKDIFNYFNEKGYGSSGSCNNNVNCPEGADWLDENRGVAMVLLSNGTRWCSGSMVNNTNEDGAQYFLTANHCLNGEEYWIYMFRYESPGCTNANGPTYYTLQGSTLLSSYSSSDFALMEITEAIPDSFNIYYNGWSNIDVASSSSVGIHHPAGDIKKISWDYDALTSANYLSTSGTTHWRVGNWEDGTTEGGSSGSPLFDTNHRIVGQLHGGYASCASITADWYGKLSLSWTGGGSSSNRLVDWLDPAGTGATTLDGYDPFASLSITHTPLENTQDTVGNYEVIALVKSSDPLIYDSLMMFYDVGAGYVVEPLTATGGTDEYHAYIPAQSAGTTIDYYLYGWDTSGKADTTEVYSFFIDYSPAIAVSETVYNEELPTNDSLTTKLHIVNIGEGFLNYNLSIDITPYFKSLFGQLALEGKLADATKTYPDGFDDYTDVKGVDDPRDGYPTDKNAGGPDGFGYYWIDSDETGGPTFDWIDISGTGTNITSGLDDDNYTGPYSLGFTFNFYGTDYTEFYLGSNGIIGFDSTNLKDRSKKSIPTASTPNNLLAWLWDDLDITNSNNSGGAVYMDSDAERCVIQFVDMPEYNAAVGDIVNAEVIIYANGQIKYQYYTIAAGFDIANNTVGIENATGTDGLEVSYLTTYLHDNLAILFTQPNQWLSVDSYSGSVPQYDSDTVTLYFNSTGLDIGVYDAEISILSNDPDPADSLLVIPVNFTVTGTATYVCGDANDDGNVNVLDITAIIDYLYYAGVAPNPLARADANGDGAVNILDITYMISYLYASGPAPICE